MTSLHQNVTVDEHVSAARRRLRPATVDLSGAGDATGPAPDRRLQRRRRRPVLVERDVAE